MAVWRILDRGGREVYLTQERWEHIVASHPDMDGRQEAVLETVQKGRREQDSILPYKYTYLRRYDAVPGFNSLVVKVLFRTEVDAAGKERPNNYIVTAWLTYVPALR